MHVVSINDVQNRARQAPWQTQTEALSVPSKAVRTSKEGASSLPTGDKQVMTEITDVGSSLEAGVQTMTNCKVKQRRLKTTSIKCCLRRREKRESE